MPQFEQVYRKTYLKHVDFKTFMSDMLLSITRKVGEASAKIYLPQSDNTCVEAIHSTVINFFCLTELG